MILDPLNGKDWYGQVLGSYLDKSITYLQKKQTEEVAWMVLITAGKLVQNQL